MKPDTRWVMKGQYVSSFVRRILRLRAMPQVCTSPFVNRRLLNGIAIDTMYPFAVRRPSVVQTASNV